MSHRKRTAGHTDNAPSDVRPAHPVRPVRPVRPAQDNRPGGVCGRGAVAKPARDPHRRLVLLVSIPLAITTIAFGVLVLYNHVFAGGAVFLPIEAAAEERPEKTTGTPGETGSSTGSIVANAPYVSEIVEGNSKQNVEGIVSTPIYLEESWLNRDPAIYNHGLALTCAAISAVANSESSYYGGKADIDFADETLGALGFDNIRTDSYLKRSAGMDEVAAIFTGDTDVTAYIFAHKQLADGQDLVLVAIRGTFGSEWISNFNLQSATDDQHLGFLLAEREVAQALDGYCGELGLNGENSAVLVCGHSRGGAVANLLAAELNSRTADRFGTAAFVPNRTYAYTFAAPKTTQSSTVKNPLHNNIFNIVNATDLIPRLPLSQWGWSRYGVTVSLPSPGSEGFDAAYEGMQYQRGLVTGYYNAKSPFAEASHNIVDEVEQRISQSVPNLETLLSFDGIVATATALGHLDVGQVVASHYPDTYLAWLKATGVSDLAFD